MSADEDVRELYRLRNETEFGYISEMTIKTKKAKEEGRAEGEEIGGNKKAVEVAKNLLKMGLSIEQVAQGTGLSIEEVNKL